jgi:hypothetical protein
MTFFIGTPFTKNAGFQWNDGRASGGALEENDVRTCTHCQAVILMQQWKRVENGAMTGGFCTKCNAPICGPCNKRMQVAGCEPFLQKLEKHIDMTVKLQQYLRDAGLEPASPRPLFTGLITAKE